MTYCAYPHEPRLQLSGQILIKVEDAEKTQLDIDSTRALYIPVANRAQILFFCLSDLANIDPMYQYSLEWFVAIFVNSIITTEKSGQPNLTRSDYTTIHTGDARHHNIHAKMNRGSCLIVGRVVGIPPPLLPRGRETVTISLRASFCRIADKTSMDYFST
uniref:Uncharacterized protein n=1 Tax=Timema poppense TaxID=170557 RepID=A0A7R9H5E2_TIMPO|nr:unnamed protein product [Timema poppensis]